jgi:hypothetical protein
MSFGNVKGATCHILMCSAADVSLGEVELSENFASEQTNFGDLTVSSLRTPYATARTQERSSLTLSSLQAQDAIFRNNGQGSISVEDGSSTNLTLECTDSGDISCLVSYSALSTTKRGRGDISFG